MRSLRQGFLAFVIFAGLLAACGATSAPSSSNVVAVTVDDGPAGASGAVNMLFITVTVCAPGSATLCQTIDHVQVDTGSTGFRVLAEVLGGGVTSSQLPQSTDASGNPIVECLQFADGYSWGPVKLADLRIGNRTVASVPIQVIGDPGYSSRAVPASCSSGVDVPENSVSQFGANGLLGIGNYLQDCGDGCASGPQDGSFYNVCPLATAPACQPASVSASAQVANPAALLNADNNGVLIQLPAVPASGALVATGNLVFGVGTQGNNGLGGATAYTLDDYGNLTTAVAGLSSFHSSFIDSGSNGYFFDDSGLQECTGDSAPFYCPPIPAAFSATVIGNNGATGAVTFTVDNAASDFNGSASALPGLGGTAGTGLGADTFDWGLPFFYGRPVYVVFEGNVANGSGASGPYVAFRAF